MIARFKKNVTSLKNKTEEREEKTPKNSDKTKEKKVVRKSIKKNKVSKKEPNNISSRPFLYNGRAIVKYEDLVYYGKSEEKYYVKIKTEEIKKIKSLKIATLVTVELISKSNDNTLPVKQSKRKSLFSAIELGNLWIKDAVENH